LATHGVDNKTIFDFSAPDIKIKLVDDIFDIDLTKLQDPYTIALLSKITSVNEYFINGAKSSSNTLPSGLDFHFEDSVSARDFGSMRFTID
jgi:hypothetical protein